MVLDDRIDVEADLIGMLHLPQHLGVELGVRLVRGILQLGVQSEVHERSRAGAEPAGLEDSPRGLEGAALFYGAQGLFLLRQVRRLAIVELRRLFPGTGVHVTLANEGRLDGDRVSGTPWHCCIATTHPGRYLCVSLHWWR